MGDPMGRVETPVDLPHLLPQPGGLTAGLLPGGGGWNRAIGAITTDGGVHGRPGPCPPNPDGICNNNDDHISNCGYPPRAVFLSELPAQNLSGSRSTGPPGLLCTWGPGRRPGPEPGLSGVSAWLVSHSGCLSLTCGHGEGSEHETWAAVGQSLDTGARPGAALPPCCLECGAARLL